MVCITALYYVHCSVSLSYIVYTCMFILINVLPPQYDGLTGLMLATLEDWPETVSVLLQCGADPNVQNKVCYPNYLPLPVSMYTRMCTGTVYVQVHTICICM